MDFLDKLVIPQSAENLMLLKYILTMALIILLPYLGFLTGISFYSVVFNLLGRRQGNELYLRFSRQLIGMATFSKGVALALGIIPAFTIILAYTQLLHGSKIAVTGFLTIALILLIPAILLIYAYKYTFNLDEIFNFTIGNRRQDTDFIKAEKAAELNRFAKSNLKVNRRSGIWGVVLLFLAAYLIMACIQTSAVPDKWSEKASVFSIIFSLMAIVKYLYFLCAAFAITSGAILFFYFRWNPSDVEDKDYLSFIRNFGIVSGMVPIFLLPLFILLSLLMTPQAALSLSLFTVTVIILVILFAVIHLYYAMVKQWSSTYSAYALYLLIIFFALAVINDQMAFDYSTQRQDVVLAANYEKIINQEKEKTGKGPAISGKDIFDGRCSACHRFDSKLVGPAYKDVLPKYEDHRDQLIKFISNPVKKNPAFPPMPNQGLKPKEVEAIAEYIMKTYKNYK